MSSATLTTMQIGAVSYLNSRPLVEGLDQLLPTADLVLDYPSRLADALAADQLDVALIPSVEYFRRPGYEIVSNACVAARGEVMSVKLYCRTHPGRIKTLALDEGSRTSAALSKVILAEKYGVIPKTEPLRMDFSTRQSSADAVLLIGDRAMIAPDESFEEVIDLGAFWYDWTGLPFVFAMWVARRNAQTEGVDAALCQARDLGLKAIHRIGRNAAADLGITEETAIHYLTKNLHYHLTSAERNGLRLFCDLASQHNLVNPNVDIVFRDFVPA
ncbi:MAG: menaquinone biosynthesis protein [Planctomycetaceae bacterium]